jgi:hypothetical protein
MGTRSESTLYYSLSVSVGWEKFDTVPRKSENIDGKKTKE